MGGMDWLCARRNARAGTLLENAYDRASGHRPSGDVVDGGQRNELVTDNWRTEGGRGLVRAQPKALNGAGATRLRDWGSRGQR
jgi:hypothetical protein